MPVLSPPLKQLQASACGLCLWMAGTGVLHAESASGALPSPPTDRWYHATGAWLEAKRDNMSALVTASAEGIDDYLQREDNSEQLANDSYVSVQLRQRQQEGGNSRFEADIKAKLRLPNTRKRLRLTFESNPDDFERISDRRRDQVGGAESARQLDDRSAIGLAVDDELGRFWKTDLNVGVQLPLPFNPYTRATLFRTIELTELWSTRLKQSISYFHDGGWRTQSRVDFHRPINKTFRFQTISAVQFIDEDDNWELYQNFSLHQRLSRDSAFEHQIGVSGDSRPRWQDNQYWIRTELRHRIYKDWLYGKLVPELLFERSGRFHMEPSLLLELQVYFGYTRNRI